MDIFGYSQFEKLEEILEEIKLHLLDNDMNKLEHLIPLAASDRYVQVRRSVNTKRGRIVAYERVMQHRLRVMTDSECAHFKKLLRHPMTYAVTHEGEELAKVKSYRGPSSLGYVLRMLGGNGYSVVRAAVYHMASPFDTKLPVIVTRRDKRNSSKEKIYVLEDMPAYVKVGVGK